LNESLCQIRSNSLFTLAFFILFSFCIILTTQHAIGSLDPDSNNQLRSKKLQDFNFVAAGDFGCGDETNRTVDGMVEKNPEFVIALGDLSYNKSAACWLERIVPLDTSGRIKITFGDHDLTKKMIKYNDYVRHFNLTKPFYSFNHANVHFLAMTTAKNSNIPYLNGSEQYNFVKEDLRSARNNKSIDWIIVYSFRPFYSSPTTHYGEDILSKTYHPIFDKYGVDIVLQAHNHNYQRTFPLRYNESSFSPQYHPIIADKKMTEYKNPNGTIFLTVGTGGAELHNFSGIAPYIAKQFESHGFLNVDVTDNGSKLTATFYENRGLIDKDDVTIKKKIKED